MPILKVRKTSTYFPGGVNTDGDIGVILQSDSGKGGEPSTSSRVPAEKCAGSPMDTNEEAQAAAHPKSGKTDDSDNEDSESGKHHDEHDKGKS